MSPRPHWPTVRRRHVLARPAALAVGDATCRCGREVLEHEPIACVGAYVVDEDGRRTVDLSGAEWVCQTCAGAPADRAAA